MSESYYVKLYNKHKWDNLDREALCKIGADADAQIAALRSQLDAVTKERDEWRVRAGNAMSSIEGLCRERQSWVAGVEAAKRERDEALAKLAASEAACAGMREAAFFFKRMYDGDAGEITDELFQRQLAALDDLHGTALLERLRKAEEVLNKEHNAKTE